MSCTLHVSSNEPLVDDLINIRVTGLTASHHVTILARLAERDKRLYSLAQYEADQSGEVNLEQSESLGGLYTGVEPMGLFWSMIQEPDQKPGVRLTKLNASTPFETSLAVYEGHAEDMNTLLAQRPLATTVINRWYLADNVQRTEITEDGLHGTFFIPKDGGPYPGVVDMFGGIGGTVEHRAALLAARGFATLALEYINLDAYGMREDLGYFETAVEWLLRQSRVIKDGAGVIGTSKGAEMAMLTAYVCKKVKAVVFINGAHHVTVMESTYKGVTFPCTSFFGLNFSYKDGSIWIKQAMTLFSDQQKEECAMPVAKSPLTNDAIFIRKVEEIDAHMLLVTSGDDECIGGENTQYIMDRMEANGKSHLCERVVYPGAGHLLEPPHTPNCVASFSPMPGGSVLWGGKPLPHARAQDDCWMRMRTFLKTHLSRNERQSQMISTSKI